MLSALIIAGAIIVAVLIGFALYSHFVHIVQPNEILVVSGRKSMSSDGKTLGYTTVRGGRTMVLPIIESASSMDLSTIPLELKVENGLSKGNIRVSIHAVANVKIDPRDPYLGNAIERFMDRENTEIAQIVRDTLEGHLRGVISQMTPEQLNEDRIIFATQLMEEAEHDMQSIGILIDTLKIQNVSDANGYLDAIGRTRNAEIQMNARKAEAERNAEAVKAEAEANERAQISQAQAEQRIKTAQASATQQINEAESALKIRTAELNAEVNSRQNEAVVQAEVAQVKAQQQLQAERLTLQRNQLEADVIEPARAQLRAAQLKAEADAAPELMLGKAQAQVVDALREVLTRAGGAEAGQLQYRQELMLELARHLGEQKIDRLVVMDSGDGKAAQNAMNLLPRVLMQSSELMDQAGARSTGDLIGQLRDLSIATQQVPEQNMQVEHHGHEHQGHEHHGHEHHGHEHHGHEHHG